MRTVFQKLNTPSLKDAFERAILERILSGELKAGDRLPPERELAEQMCISRSSVNHGILELESKGFVRIVPRRGTVVCDYRKHPTPQTLAAVMSYGSAQLDHALFSDFMATRALVEKECARLACTNIYESTLSELDELIERLSREPNRLVDHLYQFHYQLTQASGNTVYSMIYKGFEPVLRCLMEQHYSCRAGDVQESARLHRLLLDAIRAKDEPLAVRRMEDVLLQGVSALEKRYER